MKQILLFFFALSSINFTYYQKIGDWTFDEIKNSVVDQNAFREHILTEKNYYPQNGEYTPNFFVNGSNSVEFLSTKKVIFFFSEQKNYQDVINKVKAKCKKVDFKLEGTPKGKYHVSTYQLSNITFKIFKGYNNNRYIMVSLL